MTKDCSTKPGRADLGEVSYEPCYLASQLMSCQQKSPEPFSSVSHLKSDVMTRQGTDTEFPSNRVAGGVYGIQFSRRKAIDVQNVCSQS